MPVQECQALAEPRPEGKGAECLARRSAARRCFTARVRGRPWELLGSSRGVGKGGAGGGAHGRSPRRRPPGWAVTNRSCPQWSYAIRGVLGDLVRRPDLHAEPGPLRLRIAAREGRQLSDRPLPRGGVHPCVPHPGRSRDYRAQLRSRVKLERQRGGLAARLGIADPTPPPLTSRPRRLGISLGPEAEPICTCRGLGRYEVSVIAEAGVVPSQALK